MTDATLHEASATFEGAQFDAQVNVACSETGDISYTATSFDKDHKPAEMRSRTIPFGYTAGVYIDYQMRADNQPARSLSTGNPAYNNQIVLKSDAVGQSLQTDSSGIDLAESMAGASRVVLRLFMVSGEETFELPQGGKAFRDVVRPCLEQRQAKRQELTTERQQADAQTKATQIADVDRLYDDPSVDADTLVWMAKNRNVPVDEARLAQKRASERPKQLPLP